MLLFRLHNRKRTAVTRTSQLESLEERSLFSTLTVTSLADSGAGSLRAQIASAQSGDTIVFASSLSSSTTLQSSVALLSSAKLSSTGKGHGHGKPTSPPPAPPPGMITLTSGELFINKNLTIQGPGASAMKIDAGIYSYQRAFEVGANATVALSGLTINGSSNGWLSYSPFAGEGGGILNHGALTLNACTVSGIVYGPVAQGGGIYNDGTLNVSACTFSNSSAIGSDYDGNAANGGAIANWGTATLTNSTISLNSATSDQYDTYPYHNKGGGIFNRGTMTLNHCNVFANNSTWLGGGIYNAGTLTLQNASSVTGNYGVYGGVDDVCNDGVLNRDSTSTIGVLEGNAAILI
jgi:hypothetical protein